MRRGVDCGLQGRRGYRLAKPDDVRAKQPVTGRARWRAFIAVDGRGRNLAAGKAAIAIDSTVELDDIDASCALVQSIDILRNECQLRFERFQPGQRTVTGVGLCIGDELTAPDVPVPDELRVARERFGRRKFFGFVLLPEAGLCIAKRGHAALCGYARARHHDPAPEASQRSSELGRKRFL